MYPIVTENARLRQRELFFTMSDGIQIYTRIVSPIDLEKCPIVFIRTPYEEAHQGAPHDIELYEADPFLKNGFAVVLQHTRGQGDSQGLFVPYEERQDGLESLELIRQLDIYNGEIYLFGGSYLSTVHLCYLNTKPADVKGAALNIQTDRMYFRNYRNGCVYNYCHMDWWCQVLQRQFPVQHPEGVRVRPYKDIMKRALGQDFPRFTRMLLEDKNVSFWVNDPRVNVMDSLEIPVLLTEGWYDFYIGGMFSMWQRIPEATRAKSAFVVGPWGHAVTVAEEAEYPLPHGNIPEDYAAAWFRSLREGTPYPYAQTGKVNFYCLGDDSWQKGDYPVPEGEKLRLYFGENDALTGAPYVGERSVTYRYDPEVDPECYKFHNIYRAPAVGTAEGVTSFRSVPFEQDTKFFGQLRWHMPVSSDCEDTAFFIRFYLEEDGIAYNLTESLTSLSYLKENYVPGEKITLDLLSTPISFCIKKGSRLRVDISSHCGIYVPHPNVKGHWAEVTQTKVAHNTLFLGDAFLELPIF